MAKYLSTVVLDAAATVITDNAQFISIMSAVPTETSGTTAISQCNTTGGFMLAMTSLTTGSASTSWTIGDSSVTGRKIDVAEQAGVALSATGVAAAIALFSSVSGRVYAYTTCATQNLSDTANTVTIPTWIIRLAQAT